MAFEYEYENPITGELETLEIEYRISPIEPATCSTPCFGGEIIEMSATNELGHDIANEMDNKTIEDIEVKIFEHDLKIQRINSFRFKEVTHLDRCDIPKSLTKLGWKLFK